MQLILVFFLYFVFTTLPALGGFSQPARQTGGDTTCVIVWEEPILLSDTAYDAYSPKIALSGDDTVHVVWENGSGTIRLPYIRSTNSGLVFSKIQELLPDSISFPRRAFWTHIVAVQRKVYVFFVGSTAGDTPIRMLISTNAGTDWSSVRDISPDTTGIIQSVAILEDTLAILYPSPGYRRIIRSTDAGSSWTKTSEDLSVYSQIALTSSALHLVYDRGINSSAEVEYRLSHDLGDTWTQTSVLSELDGYWSDMPIVSSDGDSTLLVAWRDTKYGCLGILGCSIESRTGTVSADQNRTIWGDIELLTEKPRGFRVEASLINGMRSAVWIDEVTPNDTFHIVTRISKQNTSGWYPVIDLTPNIQKALEPVVALSSKGIHTVWEQQLGRAFGVFYRRGVFKTTDMKDDNNVMPTEVSLSQNYPNPFNPRTNIGFRISDFGFVSVKVYDVFGREVATLVNEKKQPGEYEVEWNSEGFARQTAGGLASGVYFIRMNAGKYFMTKKAILIR